MMWGPWIVHDGSGRPNLPRGTKIRCVVVDANQGMRYVATLETVVGYDGPRIDMKKVFIVPDSDGNSWTLPCAADMLYVMEYRVWQDDNNADVVRVLEEVA
jgi:hypothetical protein